MTLLAIGASYHSAPTDLLEVLAAVDADALAVDALASPHVAESMVVSTCNRVEIYAEVDRFHAAVDDVVARLAKAAGIPADEVTGLCYVHYDERAVQHLFEVAAGLNSMVVGEAQILGQVRSALQSAQHLGTAGRELNEVGQAALRVGKRVRSQTGIDRSGANVVSVGLAEASDRLTALAGPELVDCRILVVGAGALSSVAVAHAARLGVAGVSVVSRTTSKAQRLADAHDAAAAPLADLPEALADADVVVCATGALGTVLPVELVAAAMARRPERPLVVLDLALPHDSDPDIAHLPGVARIDLGHLAERPEARADRADTVAAERIVTGELSEFTAARASRAVEPVLVELRARATEVVEAEIVRLRDRMPGLTADDWALIEQSLRRTVNTLMHTPTVRMKELATDPDGQRYADALSSLFDLSVATVEQVLLPRAADGGVTP